MCTTLTQRHKQRCYDLSIWKYVKFILGQTEIQRTLPRARSEDSVTEKVTQTHLLHVYTLTRSVFLAPSVLLMMMVSGPPMEQMFFSRAPPHTGTVETVKSCTDGVE